MKKVKGLKVKWNINVSRSWGENENSCKQLKTHWIRWENCDEINNNYCLPTYSMTPVKGRTHRYIFYFTINE